MNFLKKIVFLDQFSVPIQIKYEDQKQYKTVFGLICTLIIYTICTIYGSYIMYNWINWKILPKVQTQIKNVKDASLILESGSITFGYFNDTSHNPFSRFNNILLPTLIKVNNTKYETIGPLFSEPHQVTYDQVMHQQVIMPALDLTLQKTYINDLGQNSEISYMLIIQYCNSEYLQDVNATCASNEDILNFIASAKQFLDFNINLKQYNVQTQQFDIIQKTLYFSIINKNQMFSQVLMKSKDQTINTGILFDDIKTQNFVNDVNIITDYIQYENQNYLNGDYVFEFLIRLDNSLTVENIAYNKLGEILAEIGSIVQLLLFTKYIFFTINEEVLNQEIIYNIMNQLIPELSKLEVKSNIFKKVINIKKKESLSNQENYIEDYNKISQTVKEIQNFNVLIKEIFAIEQFIFQQFGKNISVMKYVPTFQFEFKEKQLNQQQEGFSIIQSFQESQSDSASRMESKSKTQIHPENLQNSQQNQDNNICN